MVVPAGASHCGVVSDMWDKTKIAQVLKDRAGNIRLVATDLDGTFFREASVMTDRTARALELVRAKGVGFTICTGRSYYELGAIPAMLGLDKPVVCRNGAEIVDPLTGTTLYRRLIPADQGAAFLRRCQLEGIDYCLTTGGGVFYPAGSGFRHFFDVQMMGGGEMPSVTITSEETNFEALEQYKIILLTHQPGFERAREYLANFPGIGAVPAADDVLDLIAAGTDKGSGLSRAAALMGLEAENCCAFGDYINDIPMLRWAGLSFAVANAGPEVRAAADHTVPSNLEDGVAQTLEALFESQSSGG